MPGGEDTERYVMDDYGLPGEPDAGGKIDFVVLQRRFRGFFLGLV